MEWKPPSFVRLRYLSWRARAIRDPIARLRYLRRSAWNCSPGEPGSSCGLPFRKTLLLLLVVFALRVSPVSDASADRLPGIPEKTAAGLAEESLPGVWLVEKSIGVETYSNGLRIEDRVLQRGNPRAYLLFDSASHGLSSDWLTEPAGIIYHASEGRLAPLDPAHNETLKRMGEELVEYVARNCCYHFLIDRFGRVFRTVPETDCANHAGKSVWADSRGIYLNLNQGFLGVAFEGQTRSDEESSSLNAAQIHAARILTQLLRSKYRIPAGNCITHAQVSVNPGNMRIGYHTDGASNFPFKELGLPDNYALPLPSIYAFGFRYDSLFVKAAGGQLWSGLLAAEQRLRREAGEQGIPEAQFMKVLQRRYRETIEALNTKGALEEIGQ
jgi:hypothetical protein